MKFKVGDWVQANYLSLFKDGEIPYMGRVTKITKKGNVFYQGNNGRKYQDHENDLNSYQKQLNQQKIKDFLNE